MQQTSCIIQCPHCEDYLEIISINCGIFRHAVYKNNCQMDPHASQQECEKAILNQSIFGCGKPFRVHKPTNETDLKVEPCDYI